jgi:hypothetical protein
MFTNKWYAALFRIGNSGVAGKVRDIESALIKSLIKAREKRCTWGVL